MPPFSRLTCCAGWLPAAAPTPSRSATGVGCPLSNWLRSAGTGTPWRPASPGSSTSWPSRRWNLPLRVMIYRKHVRHQSPKNFQLDLFTLDDGHFEYYAVATTLPLGLAALYAFIGGRGAQEKTIAERRASSRSMSFHPATTRLTVHGSNP